MGGIIENEQLPYGVTREMVLESRVRRLEAELAALRTRAEAAEAEAFDRGLCYAIGYLWDRGEGTIAEELWDTQFKTKRVPKYIYGYDAKKCRAMLRQKRTR